MHITGTSLRSSRLKALEPIVQTWADCVVAYSTLHNGDDAAYYYGERPNVSVLCSAAWVADAVGIEEYAAEKGHGPKARPGRADLYIKGREFYFAIEAKHRWDDIFSEGSSTTIQDAIVSAKEDARDVHDGTRVAVVFLVPSCRSDSLSEFKKSPKVVIDRYVESVQSTYHDAGLIGWSFPQSTRFIEGSDGNFWPGVALLAYAVNRDS